MSGNRPTHPTISDQAALQLLRYQSRPRVYITKEKILIPFDRCRRKRTRLLRYTRYFFFRHMNRFFPNRDKSAFFEGPEKKLEIVFRASDNNPIQPRNWPWYQVVEAAGAKVVNRISNDFLDACILSESSLFVWEDRILVITCGQTKLVKAVPRILEFAEPSDIDLLIYARKNQLFPWEQPSSFVDDASFLEGLFPGKRHRLGPGDSDHADLFVFAKNPGGHRRQAAFELLMHDIDPAMIETFSIRNGNSAARAERLSGINRIYPHMVRDGFLFSPCGYSINALSGPEYFTIHVTPQKKGSYASFETNVPENGYDLLASRVVDIFKPRKFSMVLTTAIDKKASCLHKALGEKMSGYALLEKSRHDLVPDYAASFLNFAVIP